MAKKKQNTASAPEVVCPLRKTVLTSNETVYCVFGLNALGEFLMVIALVNLTQFLFSNISSEYSRAPLYTCCGVAKFFPYLVTLTLVKSEI